MNNDIEEARAVLAWVASRSSIRAVADEVGVEQSVLNRFVTGLSKKPRPDVLAKLLPFVAMRRAEYLRATASVALPGKGPGLSPDDAGGTITLSRDHVMEWRGQLKVMLRWLRAIGESAQQIHDELGEAAVGMAEMLDSSAFPSPGAPVIPLMPVTPVVGPGTAAQQQQTG